VNNFLKNRPNELEALELADVTDTKKLVSLARCIRDEGHHNLISFSRKIFIPLTKLCRDFCHYCTFAEAPKKNNQNYLTIEEVMELVKKGKLLVVKKLCSHWVTNQNSDIDQLKQN